MGPSGMVTTTTATTAPKKKNSHAQKYLRCRQDNTSELPRKEAEEGQQGG